MFTTRPEIIGTFGAVASTHWLASQSAMRILELGGNAFDAAFCGGMVLQLVEPHLNGPGGDVPIIFHDASSGSTHVVCGQAPFPAAATIDAYRNLGIDIVPATGLLAATIPGAFDGWMQMLRDQGTMSFGDLMKVPIRYAKKGFPIVKGATDVIASVEPLMREHWHSTAEIYLPDGEVPKPGTLFKNKRLAKTWKRLVAEAEAASSDRAEQIEAARDAFYKGFVAEEIDRFCREESAMDTTGRENKAFLRGDDMANWTARYDTPTTYDYHGYTVCKCGPWSQGPALLQNLAVLKGIDIAGMDPLGPEFVHTVTEVIKLGFADREAFYGDPDFVDIPMDTLLSDDYAAERRALIGAEASREFRPGKIDGYGWAVDYAAAVARQPTPGNSLAGSGGGEPTVGVGGFKAKLHAGDTCHIDVVDKHGNMVSATPSGGWLQSSPTIPALGFCLGSRAQMAWLDETSPSALGPNRRPRTTLTPSFVLRDGKPYMAFGTPGGDQQDQWQLIMLLRHIHHGMNLQEAIDAPSFHTEHQPSSFYPRHASPGRLMAEGRFSQDTFDVLKAKGHDLIVGEDWSEGRLSAVTWEDGIVKAGANPRGMQGYAVGR